MQPQYILTTDDIATFWVPSLVSQKTNLNLVPSEALKQTEVRSVYTPDTASNNNRIRIKYMHIFSIAGQTMAIFISIAGFSEHEIPKDKCPGGIILLKIF